MNRYSVIIATHRRPVWLDRAIRSVKAQTYGAVELIVVADVACEATAQVLATRLGPGDLFVQRWGLPGPADSRNLGLRLCTGDYALFLDDDDEIPPDFLTAVDARRPPHFAGIVYSDFVFALHMAGGDPATPTMQAHSIAAAPVEDVYVRNFIPNSCLIYPVGSLTGRQFDASLVLNEDWDFILNAMSGTSLSHVPVTGPLIHKTEAPRRGNSNHDRLLDSYLSIYKKWPAPRLELKLKRQALLAQNGITIALSDL